MRFEDRVKTLFDSVVSHPAPDWERLLAESAEEDAVKAEVRRLLDFHAKTTGFLSKPAAEAFASMVRAVGSRLGEFTLIREIGRGGMGVVYLAEDGLLGRRVALKILSSQALASEHDLARFRTEAKAAARLSHPGIVPVHRYGEQEGTHYIVMEYVEGETLADRIERFRAASSSARPGTGTNDGHVREVLQIISGVAEALDYAHRRNVVHRDVKPSNILLTTEGEPRLTDFGVARIGADQSITVTGEVAGTYYYMSPEQARAQRTQIDHRTDIFSLGVVLYECLTLQRPFTGESSHQVMQALTSIDPLPIRQLNPRVSRDLATVCHKALEKRPSDRYPTAGHFAADLRCCLSGEPILASGPSAWRRLKRLGRQHRVLLSASVVVLLAAGIAGLGYANLKARERLLGAISVSLGEPVPTPMVWVRSLGDRGVPDGALMRLGPPPIQGVRLKPGLYRFTITSAGPAFAEFDEFLAPGHSVERRVWLRSTQEVRAGMIQCAGGEYSFTMGDLTTGAPTKGSVRLDDLLIDEAEVTNGEYEAFVNATGHPRPYTWPAGRLEASWADLPVTGLTHSDAIAFAAWKGKRLPTIWEWMALAQAPDARRHPWGDGPVPASAIPSEAVLREEQDYSERGAVEKYARRARPARDGEETRSPLGLYHVFGNVNEMSGTVFVYSAVGGTLGVPNIALARSDWTSDPGFTDLSSIGLVSHVQRGSPRIGFRCVRSVRPSIRVE
ncbi:MAG: protein kinase [Phycisphaerae bacterium]|nr:protein kinase [Phycisphaerae bacterium]